MNEEQIMEKAICQFLQGHAHTHLAKVDIAPDIARKSLMMNHLYEDMGFASRTQMGKYLEFHFPSLVETKPKDVLWKKFLYDSIGSVAPACAGCDDSVTCFSCKDEELSA